MLDHNEKQPENRIGGLIRLAYTKAKQRDLTPLPPLQDEIGQALSPEVYEQLFLNEASYLVNKDFLGRELLQEQLRHLRAADYRLKLELPANYTLTLGVFPSTDVGRTLTEEEIKRGQYWHSLIGSSALCPFPMAMANSIFYLERITIVCVISTLLLLATGANFSDCPP